MPCKVNNTGATDYFYLLHSYPDHSTYSESLLYFSCKKKMNMVVQVMRMKANITDYLLSTLQQHEVDNMIIPTS